MRWATADPSAFLADDEVIDVRSSEVVAVAERLMGMSSGPADYAHRSFMHVRDGVRHSLDHGDATISLSASEALRDGTGL